MRKHKGNYRNQKMRLRTLQEIEIERIFRKTKNYFKKAEKNT